MTSHKHYHIVGVAGTGMNGLAQVLLAQGCPVTGSDRARDAGDEGEVLRKLAAGGVVLCPQDGSGVAPGTTGVVVSTAIEDDNADIAAARRHGVPVLHRAEMLAALVEGKPCVAVTGTSGKTTVTGMIGWALEQLGADPTVVNGGILADWQSDQRIGNVRCGRSDLWVIEADESDRSLLRFHPDWAVITNVSTDHFKAEEAEDLFRRFAGQVRRGIVGVEDRSAIAPVLTAGGSTFEWDGVRFALPLPGRHNAENALCAAALCRLLGYDLRQVSAALSTFRGIARRLETVGVAGGVRVIDDYGHNPAKIRAAWESLAPYSPRLLAAWRPHGFGPLRKMLDELATDLPRLVRPSDRLYLLPVFDAGGTADRSIGSEALAAALKARGLAATVVDGYESLASAIAREARAGDTVLIMGARDPHLPHLAREILERLAV